MAELIVSTRHFEFCGSHSVCASAQARLTKLYSRVFLSMEYFCLFSEEKSRTAENELLPRVLIVSHGTSPIVGKLLSRTSRFREHSLI